ncbi:hypothetical protein [Halodesulfovibrio spirochaetisodalis]|uniref:Uncharacterized protein n=1 Tax=Halodesulfovibrio spirochaetisodalis TaxID=1560234 RepID=A0A1B7XAA7_9BACT|nr:hypothetical protein [Halodesulfovibrio spirochaetisodalis]OBQ46319.1 hypothetical protein SP90_12960 [Halodesulfovibrio spirochaetisodalis]
MVIRDIVIAVLLLIPAELFFFIILSSICLRVAGVNLQEKATMFFLKAYGWTGKGTVVYSSRLGRWGNGIFFTILYGSVIRLQFSLVLGSPTLLNVCLFIVSCIVSFCSFGLFAGSYYSGAACDEEGLILSPLVPASGVRLTNEDIELIRISPLGSFSMVYCPQWEEGRTVMISKKQLETLVNAH